MIVDVIMDVIVDLIISGRDRRCNQLSFTMYMLKRSRARGSIVTQIILNLTLS